jgi:hypothetical protein
LEEGEGVLRLINGCASAEEYTNAQIDDYQHLRRRDFLWRPPLTLTVCARFSHASGQLSGTAGFGFWNDPFMFMMTGARRPTLPRAIWYFYASPPSQIALALDMPGHGWKAATIDALRWPFFLLAPTAPMAIPLMKIPWFRRRFWPTGQRAIHVSETPIHADMTEWHTYTIEWGAAAARFLVDELPILECDAPPRGPLGLVIWLDNQCMAVTPWGRFRHGLLTSSQPQWLEVKWPIQPGGNDR